MKRRILILVLTLIITAQIANSLTEIMVNETDFVNLKPEAVDEDADRLIYSFTEPLDENGQWQTTYGDAGEYMITVVVSDGELSSSQDVLLIVNKKEEAPMISDYTPSDNPSLDEGSSLEFAVSATDLNKDLLSYSWALDINKVSNEKSFVYTPSYEDEGTHNIKVEVSDGKSTVSQEWSVTVNNIDRSLILEGIEGVTANESDVVSIELPDFSKYNLAYSISEPLGNNNYWKTTYEDAGEHVVTVTVYDGEFKASKGIRIIVNNVDRPPVFKKIGTVNLKENQKVTINLEAADPDGDEIKYSVGGEIPSGANFDEKKFVWQPGYDVVQKSNIWHRLVDKFHLLAKTYKVKFIAKSNELTDEQMVKVRVTDVNREFGLEDLPSITVDEGQEIEIKPKASDPDDDHINFKYSGWLNKAKYTTDYDDSGEHIVTVTASDGEFKASKDVKIVVNDVNRGPVWAEIPKKSIKEEEGLEIRLNAIDPEGDSVTYSSKNLPTDSSIEDGLFEWKPGYGTMKEEDKKEFVVTFSASDGKLSSDKDANITVYNNNRAPKIVNATPSNLVIYKDVPILLEAEAEELDNEELSYKWVFGLLDNYNGTSSHIRTFTTPGDKKVKVVVSDGRDSDSYEWSIKVV
ncbi:hypothetical protein J4209_00900 [Candidatus Woesearchaeota archaeon]|nr:hypothetical protein [Candidatus Woesearchaeota archaeon]